MKQWGVVVFALALILSFAAPSYGAGGAGGKKELLQMYTATVDRAMVAQLARQGYDVDTAKQVKGGIKVDLVLTSAERDRLKAEGVAVSLLRNKAGQTVQQQAAAQSAYGFNVWRSYDEAGGIRDQLYGIAQRYPSIVKLVRTGTSIQGREILALKVTKNARTIADGSRPAAVYVGGQHAREWIGVEVPLRLLRYFVDNYGKNASVTNLVNTRELWFTIVANPDGYQYTFDGDRLWRKNLHDNDGDGIITNNDGVDPNRNFPEHWNYDDEGSSSQTTSETFRGTGPASEPETTAYMNLLSRSKADFLINYHSYGPLLLSTFGWQLQEPSADDPIYIALQGTDAKPGIPGFDPGVGGDLYITNGSHLGNTTKPFYLETASQDPEKWGNPMSDFRFSVSYGDPQEVRVLARRSLGDVTARYQINGGAVQSAPTSEWNGGERSGRPGDIYFRIMRGTVTGTSPGDVVKVWFEGGGQTSDSFTYTAKVESSKRVLVLAAEDYSGISPVYKKTTGPSYLSYYLDALAANGIGADVYDVDANARTAPSYLGVLSHYDAVIWYTGDDIITRARGMAAGTADRLANDEVLAVRAYLNAGGRLLYTGKYAGYSQAFGYEYNLETNAPCNPNDSGEDGCIFLSDDFLQYYLGAYVYNDDAGTTSNGKLYDVLGSDNPFDGPSALSWSFGGASANNQDHSASFITTSGILPASTYPQFSSWPSAKYNRPGGPFVPHTGSYYMYSNIADISYKRLTRTVDLTGQSSGNLSFWISRDTEQDWDHVLVEAHTVGQDNWTTLPDQNGHTTTATGLSCPAGWRDLHPWLDHYQTWDGASSCTSTGTTGSWNAASGSSHGWEQWSVDLSAYAGKQVEISIAYVSDWATQGLGVFIDDTAVSTGETTSFEDGAGGWTATGPPPGSSPNSNNFTRTTAAGFPEGAAVSTDDTIYFGFGFEGIATPDARNAVMGRAMSYLLR